MTAPAKRPPSEPRRINYAEPKLGDRVRPNLRLCDVSTETMMKVIERRNVLPESKS